jgi:hypothetical protein
LRCERSPSPSVCPRATEDSSTVDQPAARATTAHPGRPQGSGHVHCVYETVRTLKVRGPHVSPSAAQILTVLAVHSPDCQLLADVHNDVHKGVDSRCGLRFVASMTKCLGCAWPVRGTCVRIFGDVDVDIIGCCPATKGQPTQRAASTIWKRAALGMTMRRPSRRTGSCPRATSS